MAVAFCRTMPTPTRSTGRSHARSTRRQPTLGPTVASQTQSISSRHRFLAQPVTAQPIEPILVPKLRIQFADFPWLHQSKARGCSPWRPAADMGTAWREHYERLARIFKYRQSCIGHHKKCGALRALLQYPYLRLSRFQGFSPLQRRENSSRDSYRWIRDRLRYRTEPIARFHLRVQVREY